MGADALQSRRPDRHRHPHRGRRPRLRRDLAQPARQGAPAARRRSTRSSRSTARAAGPRSTASRTTTSRPATARTSRRWSGTSRPGARYTFVNYHTQLELSQAVDWLVERARRQAAGRHRRALALVPRRPVRRHRRGRAGRRPRARRGHHLGQLGRQLRAAPLGGRRRRPRQRRLGEHRPGRPRLPRVPADRRRRHGRDALLERLHARPAPPVAASSASFQLDVTDTVAELAGRVRPGPEGRRAARRASSATCPPSTGTYGLRIAQATPGVVCDLEIFGGGVELGDEATPESSIPTPGDARGSFTVGARDWQGDAAADYSSQGPTQDGRLKPDVVAPASTAVWPGIAMVGTSASAPHAAGAAALLMQRDRAAGPAERSRHDRAGADRERPRHRAAGPRRGHRRGPHPARRRSARVGLDDARRRASRWATRRASRIAVDDAGTIEASGVVDRRRRRGRGGRAPARCASTRARSRPGPHTARVLGARHGRQPLRAGRRRSCATSRRPVVALVAGGSGARGHGDRRGVAHAAASSPDRRRGGRAQRWQRTLPLTFAAGRARVRASRAPALARGRRAACASRRSTRSATPPRPPRRARAPGRAMRRPPRCARPPPRALAAAARRRARRQLRQRPRGDPLAGGGRARPSSPSTTGPARSASARASRTTRSRPTRRTRRPTSRSSPSSPSATSPSPPSCCPTHDAPLAAVARNAGAPGRLPAAGQRLGRARAAAAQAPPVRRRRGRGHRRAADVRRRQRGRGARRGGAADATRRSSSPATRSRSSAASAGPCSSARRRRSCSRPGAAPPTASRCCRR